MLAEEVVLRLRRTNPQIRLILVLPFCGQEGYWGEEEQRRYERIQRSADNVTVLYDKDQEGCFRERNERLARQSG